MALASPAGRSWWPRARSGGRPLPPRAAATAPELLVSAALVAVAVAAGMAWLGWRADRERLADARADAAFLQSALVTLAVSDPGGLPSDATVRDYQGLRLALAPRAELPPEAGLASFRFARYERVGPKGFRLVIRARDASQSAITITEGAITASGDSRQTQWWKRFPWYSLK